MTCCSLTERVSHRTAGLRVHLSMEVRVEQDTSGKITTAGESESHSSERAEERHSESSGQLAASKNLKEGE